MADVSRSVYLSRKFSSVNEDSSKHVYDGIFSAPAATNGDASTFAARIDEYREIFPPSSASLGSTIPILDLPAADRGAAEFDYAGVFGGLGDNDGIEVATEKFFSSLKKSVKRETHPPRIPVPTRRVPSKSQEFSFNNGNDQISSPEKTKRMPSKSQEFSCNYGNDQTLGPAQACRVPSKSQEFVSNHGNDQTSSLARARRTPSTSQEVSSNYVTDQTSSPGKASKLSSESQKSSGYSGNYQTPSPAQTRRIPSKSQEFPCNHGNEQTSSPAQTRRMPSKSQEFSFHNENDEASTPAQPSRMPSKSPEFSSQYGNDEALTPAQARRMPSKSQEFPCNNGNDQMSRPPELRKQYSQSQEFPSNFSTNQMPTSPVERRRPFLSNEGDTLSGTSPNVPTSASLLPHETVDSVKHASFSYNKTNQSGIDSPNGMTHIAHLHAVPGYTHLFDETGPVRKPSFDKAKRLSMDDADFSAATGEVSKQGKHLRTVSDLGTNQQARDLDKPQIRSMSMSNSPQSFGSSGYYKRSSRRRNKRSTNNQENISYANPFLLLDEELDVNSTAAVSAAAVKRAIEEAEIKIRWAKEFLKDLEGNGFIKPTLKDSFKVNFKGEIVHSYYTYGMKQNGSMKVKPTRQKKYFNEEKVLKQSSHLNSNVPVGDCHGNEAGEVKPSQKQLQNEATGLEQALHVPSADVDNRMSSPAPENLKETQAFDELKFAEKRCKDESGGEWEAAKHISQLFTGVKNRFVSFMSKQADTEKTAIQKDVPSNCEFMEQSRERLQEVRNLNNDRELEADLDHTVEAKHSTFYPAGKTAQDSIGTSVDVEICKAKDHELSTVGSASSPDAEVLTSKQCRLSEPEEEMECADAQVSANSRNDGKKDFSPEAEGELPQEVWEQNQEMLDEEVKIQNDNQMGTSGPEERGELLENACQAQAWDDIVKNQEENEVIVNMVPDQETDETGADRSLNKEAVTNRQIEGCNLTEIEMPKDAERKQEVRMVEETSMVEECCEARVGEGEKYGGKEEDIERIMGQDECLTEVVNDVSKHDEDLTATDELFLSRNQEASLPDTINHYVQGVMLFSEERGSMAESPTVPVEPKVDLEQPRSVQSASELIEQTSCSNDVVDDDSEHDEYLPAVDDILDQDEFISSSRNEEASEHVDLPSQEGRLTEATSGIFEHEGNSERPRSVEMADQLDEECNSDVSVSDIEGADESSEHDDYQPRADDECEKDDDSCLNRNTETGVPGKRQNAQEERAYAENKRMSTARKTENGLAGEMLETSMSAGDVLDLDDMEKETKEADDPSPFIDIEITERDSVLKFEQKLSDEDDESEVSTREANEAANEHSDLSHRRRRWFVSRDEVAKFQQPGIFQGTERAMEMDQENLESLAVEDRVENCIDEIVTNSGEQADGESDELQSTEGSHRRRRWFENSGESIQLKPSAVNPVGVTAVMDHEIVQEFKSDVSSETVDEKLVNLRKDVADEMENVNITSDKAGHRRRRWFESGQKSEDPDTTKQELPETSSSSSESANTNTQQSEEKSKAREKEKERQAVERAIREARQRAFADAKERANAVKAAASIQDRTGKSTYEAKPVSDKVSMDAKLRAERAAVERATTEARERALQKSVSEKVIYKSREKVEFKNLNTGSSSSGHSTSVPFSSDRPTGATESPQRRKAISERNKRTTERAAKALEEKNMRDVLVQKEQAERNRFAGALDIEVKRWSTGKEGNLRSLLSTLQYVLGPDSGWQPIPLTDLVTTTAIRKAYKRAALCVHPDKLQQRRATIQQKYICEKVFDLLKDAWHKFNPDDR